MALTLDAKIEAVLFFKSEPVSVEELARVLNSTPTDIQKAIVVLRKVLARRGIVLLEKDGSVALGTAPAASEIIEGLIQTELSKDLGKAGIETLSIILYRGPVSRSEIDYIRGVSSTFVLRNLMVRGLVERIPHPDDQRSFLYQPTFELLSYLGITKVEDLPEYAAVRNEIEDFENRAETQNNSHNGTCYEHGDYEEKRA